MADHYLVTGGAGFIGSHLVEALVAAGNRVRVLDDFSTGRRENLGGLLDALEIVGGDVRDQTACLAACEGVDYVLHQAARVSVAESMEDPVTTHEVNASGTLKLLVAARQAGCRRLVYAGSASAYGEAQEVPLPEDTTPSPRSPYAVAKYVGELYCGLSQDSDDLPCVVLRYFNVFGPRQDPNSPYSGVIARFLHQLIRGESLTIFGDGEQSRDFVAVQNVVEANLLACTAADAPGRTLNIGSGGAITINDLVALLGELTGTAPRVTHASPRPGDIRHSLADITQAQRLLGYRVRVSTEEGLRRTLRWYRQSAGEGAAAD